MDQHFRVHWKLNKKRQFTLDIMAASLQDVLRILEKSEGVSVSTVEYMYVHQYIDPNRTVEVLAVDSNMKPTSTVEPGEADKKVISMDDVRLAKANGKVKPRIRLKSAEVLALPAPKQEPHTMAGLHMYKVMEAL